MHKYLLCFAGVMSIMAGCSDSLSEHTPISQPSSTPKTESVQAVVKAKETPVEPSFSDDAQTPQEEAFHSSARALVISYVKTNELGISGSEFRVKGNPVGKGCFVYEPHTRFNGVERPIVWWVPKDGKAYALNSPSKMVTPHLKWPREEGADAPATNEVVDYVFEAKPMNQPTPRTLTPQVASFTVKEYKIYRSVMDTPVSEEQAYQDTAKQYGVSVGQARKAVDKVQDVLFNNNWFGSPDSEIRHATDWNGD